MPVRVSPYLLSLIDWSRPTRSSAHSIHPAGSRRLPDHPKWISTPCTSGKTCPCPAVAPLSDKFSSCRSTPARLLSLLHPQLRCGLDTEEVTKLQFGVDVERWRLAFEYVASRPEVEDILISGGMSRNCAMSR